jgi:hypothetical protein
MLNQPTNEALAIERIKVGNLIVELLISAFPETHFSALSIDVSWLNIFLSDGIAIRNRLRD